ncbi:MAG: carbon storage regulator [Oscillospiraceae bacterium]|nr:carbon storage regulator [Oscillospiraceae bacterium]
MLKLSLTPGEYLAIGENVVVQLSRCEGGRAYLSIDAPREIPIVRGAVLEREGGQRPPQLMPGTPKGHKSDLPL